MLASGIYDTCAAHVFRSYVLFKNCWCYKQSLGYHIAAVLLSLHHMHFVWKLEDRFDRYWIWLKKIQITSLVWENTLIMDITFRFIVLENKNLFHRQRALSLKEPTITYWDPFNVIEQVQSRPNVLDTETYFPQYHSQMTHSILANCINLHV